MSAISYQKRAPSLRIFSTRFKLDPIFGSPGGRLGISLADQDPVGAHKNGAPYSAKSTTDTHSLYEDFL